MQFRPQKEGGGGGGGSRAPDTVIEQNTSGSIFDDWNSWKPLTAPQLPHILYSQVCFCLLQAFAC